MRLYFGICFAFLLTGILPVARGDEGARYFQEEVWAKVLERRCIKCHNPVGDAEDSRLVLKEPGHLNGPEWESANLENQRAFAKVAGMKKNGASLLLQKVVGGLEHEGKEVLKRDSTAYRILEGYSGDPLPAAASDYRPPAYFADILMLDAQQLLRRVTLSLCGRLPTAEEKATVVNEGLEGMGPILDGLMKEEAFYVRLSEGFNDILLTMGHDDVLSDILGYRNFSNSRLWFQKVDFSHIKDRRERDEAGWSLAREYGANLLREPFELIEFIVRNERPITELVTADYLMVSPYTARSYGIYDKIKAQFSVPENPSEFIQAKLPALTKSDGKPDQESPTGFYPHSGLLTTLHYLQRYPTTDTNRNRLRVRKFYEHFLGIDIMALAVREGDAAAIAEKYSNPVMEAAECVVCHRIMDPVAGLFQDYNNSKQGFGPYGPREEGWFTDVFSPGFEGRDLPPSERWRALQWLGGITAKDPRFAVAMVEHVYYILFGRKVLLPPEDIDDPMFGARRRAHMEQRQWIGEVAEKLVHSNFNLKVVFKELILSPFYRADGLATGEMHPERLAELDDVGLMHLLTPEQLDRKIEAVFGKRWENFGEQLKMLYGGIDSKEVTVRLHDPSGAMGAIQRILSNEVACKNVSRDFAKPAGERVLFPEIELGALPGVDEETDALIRRAVSHLHEHLLGYADAQEMEATFQLFAAVIKDAHERGGFEATESYSCKSGGERSPRDPDPDYTLRAWRGVVTYLLRQPEFLYE